jgi:hypothetical protein
MTILLFVYFGTHNKKIHTICKQTSVFVLIFYHVVVLLLLAKQQQQNIVNLYTISFNHMLGPLSILYFSCLLAFSMFIVEKFTHGSHSFYLSGC